MAIMAGCASVGAGLPFTAPAPYTESGDGLNGTELRSAHLTGLEGAGSFSSRSTLVVDGEDHAFEVNRSAVVHEASNRSLSEVRYHSDVIRGDGLVVASYTNGTTTYRQVEIDAGQQTVTRYAIANEPYDDGPLAVQPVNPSRAAHSDLVEAVADDVDWTMVGVERYDGGWITRYEASGPGNFSAIGSTAMAEGESTATDEFPELLDLDVRSITATLLVSPDGVVRLFEVHMTGNAAGRPIELTLTMSTDSTDVAGVEAPAWIDEARQKTAG